MLWQDPAHQAILYCCLGGRYNAAGEAALLAASVAGIHGMARIRTAPAHLLLIAD